MGALVGLGVALVVVLTRPHAAHAQVAVAVAASDCPIVYSGNTTAPLLFGGIPESTCRVQAGGQSCLSHRTGYW
jgi:hypothetical protein